MTHSKISPAFEPFLEDTGSSEKRDAIVVLRPTGPRPSPKPVRGRLRKLQERLDYVKAKAKAQQPVQARVFERYKREGRKRHTSKSKPKLAMAGIGSGAMPFMRVEVTPRTLPALAEQADVLAVLPNQKIGLIEPKKVDYQGLGTSEKNSGVTWGLKALHIPEMWDLGHTGKDIRVGVLDTGVHGDHPVLGEGPSGRVKDFIVADDRGRWITTSASFDSGSHGTHVCGTIAGGQTPEGVSIGVAPDSELYVAGVLVGEGRMSSLLAGIDWAVGEKGVDIISMSLGFSYYEPLFVEIFQMLIDDWHVLPVVAIGNENHGNMSSPGNARNSLAVGALEKMAGGKVDVAFFSSGASLTFPNQVPDLVVKPDVVAPGVQVYSCIPPEDTPQGTFQYTYMDGTSMATPHVAGVAALLMEAHPEALVPDIIQALKETAKHPDGAQFRPDNRWGYGRVRPLEALAAL